MVANKRLRRQLDWNWDTWYEEHLEGEPLSYESLVKVRNFVAKNTLFTIYERLSEIYAMKGDLREKELLKLINETYREL